MVVLGANLSIIPMILGTVLVAIASTTLTIKAENRKKTWPWIVGGTGIIMLAINSLGFVITRNADTYEVTRQAEGITGWVYSFVDRVYEVFEPFQAITNGISAILGAILLVIGIIALIKHGNRQKAWPWIMGGMGLVTLVSNGIWFLL